MERFDYLCFSMLILFNNMLQLAVSIGNGLVYMYSI